MLEVGGDLDLLEEPFRANHRREFESKDLDGDPTVVLDVVSEVHGRHAAGTELALDGVAVRKRAGEAFGDVCHMN